MEEIIVQMVKFVKKPFTHLFLPFIQRNKQMIQKTSQYSLSGRSVF